MLIAIATVTQLLSGLYFFSALTVSTYLQFEGPGGNLTTWRFSGGEAQQVMSPSSGHIHILYSVSNAFSPFSHYPVGRHSLRGWVQDKEQGLWRLHILRI